MTTNTITSTSVSRPYIGARHNRHYLNTPITSLNEYTSLTNSLSNSFQSIEPKQKCNLLDVETTDNLQTQQEEQPAVKYLSSSATLDEQELHLKQQQKVKGLLPSSLSSTAASSSLFLSPTTHNITPLSDYNHSPPSFTKQQQHFSHQNEQQSYWQPSSSENKNNQLLLQEEEESSEYRQSTRNSLTNHNQNVNLIDIPEENNLCSSLDSLSTTHEEQNNGDNHSYLLPSTLIFPSLVFYHPTTSNNILSSLSSDKDNNSTSLRSTSDNLLDQSSSISTVGLTTDHHHTVNDRKLENMSSSLRHASITSHPYDQRVSDQGNKYIIQLKTDEYQQEDFIITPRNSFHQLIVDAKHREEDTAGGFIHRELHKIFNIPKHIDLNQYAYTYNKNTQELTIEMPHLPTSSTIHNTSEPLIVPQENRTSAGNNRSTNFPQSTHNNNSNGLTTTTTDSPLIRNSNTSVAPSYESSSGSTKPFNFDLFHQSAFRPQIVPTTSNDNTKNEKKLLMSLDLSDYQVEDIKISVKDRELIVNAERITETGTRKSRSSFFQSTSLPPQADIEHLQTNFLNGKLTIEAPYLDQHNIDRKNKTMTTNSTNNQLSSW